MPTTFGDLTALAQDHLRYAAKRDLASATPAELVAVTCALAAATARVTDLVTEPPHRPRDTDPDPAWRLVTATVTEQVTRARELLALTTATLVPERAAFRHTAAAHLLAGRAAVGASRDLLATHIDLTSAGPVDRSPEAALLKSAEARHQLVVTAAGYAEHLAELADLLAVRTHDSEPERAARLRTIAVHLGSVAATPRFLHRGTERDLPINALEAVPLPGRPSVHTAATTPEQLLDQALTSVRRIRLAAFQDLGAPIPLHHSAGTLSFVASAMLAGHVAQQKLLDRICGMQLDVAGMSVQAQAEAAALRNQAGLLAWTTAREHWAGVRGLPSSGSDSGVRLDVAGLVECLRALATTPGLGQPRNDQAATVNSTMTGLSAVALRRILEGLSCLQDTEGQIAGDHAQIATALAAAGRVFVRTRTLDHPFERAHAWSPVPEDRLAALSRAWPYHGRGEPPDPIRCPQQRPPARFVEL